MRQIDRGFSTSLMYRIGVSGCISIVVEIYIPTTHTNEVSTKKGPHLRQNIPHKDELTVEIQTKTNLQNSFIMWKVWWMPRGTGQFQSNCHQTDNLINSKQNNERGCQPL